MHRRHRLHVAQRRWLADRTVLQPRRQAGRDGERDPRRSPGQRHRHDGGRSRLRPGRWAPAATASTSRTTGRTRRRCTAGATRRSSVRRTMETPTATSRRHGSPAEGGTSILQPSRPIQAPTAACTRAATRISGKAPTAGRRGRIRLPIPGTANEVDVAPTNSNNVVVAVGGRVLVSTNALGAFTLKDITRNLPGRFVARVAFDPNDPTTIYAVLGGFSGFPGGHVFRTTLAATTWTDISPPLDLPFNALALDGSETPPRSTPERTSACCAPSMAARTGACSTISISRARRCSTWCFTTGELRAATFGRGVFSFVKPTGPVDRRRSRRRPRLRHRLRGIDAVPDNRGLQRRRQGSASSRACSA